MKHVIYQKVVNFMQKKDGYDYRLESAIFCMYFTDQNLMQRGDPKEMNFEVLEMQN